MRRHKKRSRCASSASSIVSTTRAPSAEPPAGSTASAAEGAFFQKPTSTFLALSFLPNLPLACHPRDLAGSSRAAFCAMDELSRAAGEDEQAPVDANPPSVTASATPPR